MPIVDGSSIQNFDPLPDGTYDCELEKYENKPTKANDSTNANLIFIVSEEGEFFGRKIFVTKSLKPAALWSFKRDCVALGADPEEFVGEFDTDEILDRLIGNSCRIRVSINKEGQYVGKQNVEEIMAPAYTF